MAKGFGTPPDHQLGYVLLLVPQIPAYAVNRGFCFSFEKKTDGPFLGITTSLEEANVWQSKKQAEKDAHDYMGFLLDEHERGNLEELKIIVQVLSKNVKGILKAKTISELYFMEISPED
jgi:hypothetical protein